MEHFNNERIKNLTEKARIGWWEADFVKQHYICSDFICKLLNLNEDGIISFEDFRNLISDDYLLRTVNEFSFGKTQNIYDQVYPIKVDGGIQWVRVKLCSKETDADGNLKTFGFMECLDFPDQTIPEESALQRLNNLFSQQNSISRSLFSLLQTDNISTVINKILGNILQQYPKGRIYIVEYNPEELTHTCRYQACNEQFPFAISHLIDVPVKNNPWWTRQLIEQASPIILAKLDELPPEAAGVKQDLASLGIKSTLVVPMLSINGVWGYAGIDIVDQPHIWKNEDYQWFSSLVNIISICLELRKSEEKALAEKQYLADLYKHMPIGYARVKVLYNAEGDITDFIFVDANDACLKLYETDTTNFGKKASEMNLDLESYTPGFIQALNSKQPYEKSFYLEKQKKYCHSLSYSPQNGEIVFLFSDMTEIYTTHKALDRSERILRNIYRNLPVGLELYDQNGYLIDVNEKELDIFGLNSKEDVLGINIFENPILPKDMKEKLLKKEDADFSQNYEFSKLNGFYKSNKSQGINLLTKITTLYDAQNNFINYLLINIDRTEATVAYNQIQEFKDFFTLVGDYAKVGYAHFDALTRDGYALSSWYRNVGEADGTPLPQIIGVYGHFHPEDQVVMIDFLNKVERGEATSLRKDVRILHENNRISWTRVNVLVRNYKPEQGFIEMLCINYDITELKNIETKLIEAKDKAEESDRLKSAFLANMSHEIRTPLNAIVGFSSILAETEDPEEKKQYLEIVEKNNELLLQLISDILDLSKIEAGTFDMSVGEVNFNQLCNDIVQILRPKTSPNVELRFIPGATECTIFSDRNRLQQVIINFVNNAQKFTSLGSITIGYHLRDEEIEIYVSDTGIGILPEKQKDIFQRFIKLNTFVHGTGLGLSICKSIVDQMGGRIGVESEPGKGSRFWFILPLKPASALNTQLLSGDFLTGQEIRERVHQHIDKLFSENK